MRQKLNENPKYQLAMVALLILVGGYMFFGRGGGSSAAPPATDPAAVTATDPAAVPTDPAAIATGVPTDPAATLSAAPIVPAPPLPPQVLAAYDRGDIVALLIVRGGGIDDRLVAGALRRLSGTAGVAPFVVTANHIARYAAITLGATVDRVPALVILHPREESGAPAAATVKYGFQSAESIEQAVRDATYRGRIVGYAPD